MRFKVKEPQRTAPGTLVDTETGEEWTCYGAEELAQLLNSYDERVKELLTEIIDLRHRLGTE